jgi:hypothetical protein
VTVCIDDEKPPYHTVLISGHAQVVGAPGTEWRLALAVHYLGRDSRLRYIESNDGEGGSCRGYSRET